MQRMVQILVGLIALLFLAIGLNALLNPPGAAVQFGLAPQGIVGLNSLRGDFAGMFLGAAILLGMGLLRRQTVWFLAVAVLMGTIASGRLLGFVLDGFAGNSVASFGAELVFVVVLVAAHRLSRAAA